jgi:hypothetical protein
MCFPKIANSEVSIRRDGEKIDSLEEQSVSLRSTKPIAEAQEEKIRLKLASP